MDRETIERVLNQAKSCGVHNLLVLRGDPPRHQPGGQWGVGDVSVGYCGRAIDLVKLIRELHGDYFGIAVAGHPEGHSSSESPEQELRHLKEKIEAGADLIITQLFYDGTQFLEYVQRCRRVGITCPILPGIMPIQSYSSFLRMTEFCNISVPNHVMDRLRPIKGDDEAVKAIGCKIAVDMAREILNCEKEGVDVDGIHFYTLNLERSVTTILRSMGVFECKSDIPVWDKGDACTDSEKGSDGTDHGLEVSNHSENILLPRTRRSFPWRPSTMERRGKEDVRPINWANRPKSYINRTDDWDEFPNGRWGDSSSPGKIMLCVTPRKYLI